MSKRIRWSLDLRWQNPDQPAGFYGMKEHLLFRTSKNPDHKIDWTGFDGDDRWAKQKDSVADLQDVLPVKYYFLSYSSHGRDVLQTFCQPKCNEEIIICG